VGPFQKLLRFVFENPIVLFVVVAWIAGAIGNVLRAAKKRQAQSGQQPGRQPAARWPASTPPRSASPQRSAEQVAAEMRRILGLEPEPARTPAPKPAVVRREATIERPPTPVMPSAQDRRLVLHTGSHVGEGMQHREAPHGAAPARQAMGTLGGRVQQEVRPTQRTVHTTRRRLVAVDDLKRAFVMNEVLGKPLGLRDL
jgi:hypothetical protein